MSTEYLIQDTIRILIKFSTLRYSLDLHCLIPKMTGIDLTGSVRKLSCVATHTYRVTEY